MAIATLPGGRIVILPYSWQYVYIHHSHGYHGNSNIATAIATHGYTALPA